MATFGPVSVFAVIISGFLVMRGVASDAKRSAAERHDHFLLRANRGMLALGLIAGIGGSIAFAVLVSTTPFTSPLEGVVAAVSACLVIVPGIWVLLDSVSRRYSFDRDGIMLSTWGRTSVQFAWHEVRAARFRGFPPALVLHGSKGEVLRIGLVLGGIEELLSVFEQHVPGTVCGGAVANVRLFRANLPRIA